MAAWRAWLSAWDGPSRPVQSRSRSTALDAILNGGQTSASVRLYNGSGTIIALNHGHDERPNSNGWLNVVSAATIGTTVLLPNTTYYIAQDISATSTAQERTTTPTMINGMHYNTGVATFGAGMDPTIDNITGADASTVPFKGSTAFIAPIFTESTRLVCPAPTLTVWPAFAYTIAFDFTCLHTFQREFERHPLFFRWRTRSFSLARDPR